MIYAAYFDIAEETSGITAGKYAIAFNEAVAKLPENIDRFDKLLMDNAIVAYNALMSRPDEKAFVTDETMERFATLRIAYNVNVTTAKIARIFDVDNSEYTYNLIKDARASYLALSDAEREMIANAEVLDTKIDELAKAMGCELNFDLTYGEHFATVDPEPPHDDPPAEDNGLVTVIIVICACALGAAAIAVAIVLILKNKKKKTSEATDTAANTEQKTDATDVAENNDTPSNEDVADENGEKDE